MQNFLKMPTYLSVRKKKMFTLRLSMTIKDNPYQQLIQEAV